MISGNYQGVLASGADCQIQGNLIGTDITGTKQLANNSYGISAAYSTNLHVGGRTTGARNIISGNDWGGVELAYSTGSVVEGNYIGTDITGKLAMGNGIVDYGFYGYGVAVDGDGTATIGGNTAAARNLISGNVYGGVSITGWANGTVVSGNYIGTDVTGAKAVPNHGPGIYDVGLNSQVGGTAASAGNLISGNSIGIYANGATGTQILSNRIGTDASGKKSLGNTAEGVLIDAGANGVVVGTPTSGNTIAFNGGAVSLSLMPSLDRIRFEGTRSSVTGSWELIWGTME